MTARWWRILQKDQDFSEDDARGLIQQVKDQGYDPPNRSTIRGYQDLDFPVYENISTYRQRKAES